MNMNQWQPMTDEDWEWVNHGTLPAKLPKPVDNQPKPAYN
jgi:hypothetical protein